MISQITVDPDTLLIIIAAGLGALLGLERELARKDPSLRTFMLICLGSCLFSILSLKSAEGVVNAEPSRIAAQIVVGIGFLGAGAIYRSRERITGLTTAALMWVTAAIGMSIGFNHVHLGVITTAVALIFMIVLGRAHQILHHIMPEEDLPAEDKKANKADK